MLGGILVHYTPEKGQSESSPDFKRRKTLLGQAAVTDRVVQLNSEIHDLRAVLLVNPTRREEFDLLTNVRACEDKPLQKLYKARWQIEILFRTVKQCFGLKTNWPIGRTLNAVMIQIYGAIIAYFALSIYRS